MDQPVLQDKSHRPDDSDLAEVLGRAKRWWDDFFARVQIEHPQASVEWKYYASGGWRLIVRDKRRNLAYLRPDAKCFLVSFAFGDDAVEAAEKSDLPDAIVKPIRQSPKLPEGRAVRIEVRTAKDLAIALKLLAIKIAH